MCYIYDNIKRAAQAEFGRGTTSAELYDEAKRQEEACAEVSADFTRAIASVVASLESRCLLK
jgi:hypothetical protein